MAKETITCMYWKSAYDIIGVNYSVHSNNQKEYMQDSIMHIIAINQGPALPNNFLAQKCMII